jgi:hypothetical protein
MCLGLNFVLSYTEQLTNLYRWLSDRCSDRGLCIGEKRLCFFCKVSEEIGEPINIVKVNIVQVSHVQYIYIPILYPSHATTPMQLPKFRYMNNTTWSAYVTVSLVTL